jgi:hypothetical protein
MEYRNLRSGRVQKKNNNADYSQKMKYGNARAGRM